MGRIDVLINNAGITQDARLAKMSSAQFDSVIAVNVKGVFECNQAAAESMVAQGAGSIVNAVCPGCVNTAILPTIPDEAMQKMRAKVPLGRLGTPEETAAVYMFLASDDASYLDGAVIEVSGGIQL